MLGGLGFIFGCPLRCSAQLGGRLATVCLLRLRPAVVWFALLLQALLFCCGLRHALWWSLFIVAGCLGNGRLHQQWVCISVGTGCLGNGWLRQQWACISVVVGCLGNGRCPSPTSCTILGSAVLAVKLSTWSIFNCCFVCFCGGGTRSA